MSNAQQSLQALIDEARRDHEYWYLGGPYPDDECPDPYTVLLRELVAAADRVRALQSHAHQWVAVSDYAPCYCSVCGASGDA